MLLSFAMNPVIDSCTGTQGDFSVRVEALDDSQVQSEVLSVLHAMFPKNISIPEPLAFHFPRWHSNPLFRGSYSNWPPSFTSGHHQNLKATVQDRLWFAGEATSMKYFGTQIPFQLNVWLTNVVLGFLHGAYFEGHDVAITMSKCINGKGCAALQHVEDVRNAKPYQI